MLSRKSFVEKKEGLLLYFQSPYTRLWQYRASANTIRMVRGKKCDETDYSLLFLLLLVALKLIILHHHHICHTTTATINNIIFLMMNEL